MSAAVPSSIERIGPLVEHRLRAALKQLDPHLGLIASYQMGWCDAAGNPSAAGGKSIRPTLAVLSAEAVGAPADVGLAPAAAVELVHNFSLLHDDVMDRDVERRHRPTGWVVFGESHAILAGSAMFAAAFDVLVADPASAGRTLPSLLEASRSLITGQSADLFFEKAENPQIAECLEMEAGKTAALLSCASSIGALAADADPEVVSALAGFGWELGMAFQLVDDVLGITGDPAVTGKSSSSDIRSGKRSAPVVAALTAGTQASAQLAQRMADGPPVSDEDVAQVAELVVAAGGIDWALAEADRRMTTAVTYLESVSLVAGPGEAAPGEQLRAIADYVVTRSN